MITSFPLDIPLGIFVAGCILYCFWKSVLITIGKKDIILPPFGLGYFFLNLIAGREYTERRKKIALQSKMYKFYVYSVLIFGIPVFIDIIVRMVDSFNRFKIQP
jgi:hypothetical protein